MNEESGAGTAMERVRSVRRVYEQRILAKANVVGLGIGLTQRRGRQTSEIGLIVFVTHKLPRALLAEEDLIPPEIEGVPVDVQAVGQIRAQEGSETR